MEDNYKNFVEHVMEWTEKGIPFGVLDLIKLANEYGMPIPEKYNGQYIQLELPFKD